MDKLLVGLISVMVQWILLMLIWVRGVSYGSLIRVFCPFECNGEPLVMVPLATENLAVSESNHMEVFERKP